MKPNKQYINNFQYHSNQKFCPEGKNHQPSMIQKILKHTQIRNKNITQQLLFDTTTPTHK